MRIAGTGTKEQTPTSVDGADRGNQPIYRRVDTISKQYQVSSTKQHESTTRTTDGPGTIHRIRGAGNTGDTGKTRSDGHDGGGAPWES